MNFFKKMMGNGSNKTSGCCGVQIKEVGTEEKEPCCTTEIEDACC